MYTIKNISSKIIHIGTTILMPDATMKASESIAKSPAIKALANRTMLEITAPVVKVPKQEEVSPEQHDEQAGEGEEATEESSEGQAPAGKTKAKGARRTSKPKEAEE